MITFWFLKELSWFSVSTILSVNAKTTQSTSVSLRTLRSWLISAVCIHLQLEARLNLQRRNIQWNLLEMQLWQTFRKRSKVILQYWCLRKSVCCFLGLLSVHILTVFSSLCLFIVEMTHQPCLPACLFQVSCINLLLACQKNKVEMMYFEQKCVSTLLNSHLWVLSS